MFCQAFFCLGIYIDGSLFGLLCLEWTFLYGGSSKFQNCFFGDGPIKEAHCKTTPSHSTPQKKQKDLKGTPTNQYGSHYYIIFSHLMVIKLCLKMSWFFRNYLFEMWRFKRKLKRKKKIQKIGANPWASWIKGLVHHSKASKYISNNNWQHSSILWFHGTLFIISPPCFHEINTKKNVAKGRGGGFHHVC